MKALTALLPVLFLSSAFAGDAATETSGSHPPSAEMHRYLIERTFPAGALDGLDASVKAKVNARNATVGVRWLQSYANADKTKTYCLYEGPSEAELSAKPPGSTSCRSTA